MESLWRDVRFGFRVFKSKPRFSLTAISAIALGVALSTVVFTFVNAVLLRPLPFSDPDRLVAVFHANAKSGHILMATSDYFEFEQRTQLMEGVAALAQVNLRVTGREYAEEVAGSEVSENFFSVLGVNPSIDRLFGANDDRVEEGPIAILSHSHWVNNFGADPGVIGQKLIINKTVRTVVGVLQKGFEGSFGNLPNPSQIWLPIVSTPGVESRRGAGSLRIIARLKPNISLDQAQQETQTIAAELASEYPKSNSALSVKVYTLQDEIVGRTREPLLILIGAVAIVLLIACANVASMLLSRGIERQKEIAVRAALGARRGRIVQQLLTECVMLSLIGGAFGLLLATWGVRAMLEFIPPDVPRADETTIDSRVILFTVATSCLTGVVFGCWPALKASKIDLIKPLREQADQVASSAGRVVQGFFIVTQLSLTLILLIGAALMITSWIRLYRVDPGLDTDNLLTALVARPRSVAENETQWASFFSQVIERLETAPGIEEAAAAYPLTLGGSTNTISLTTGEDGLNSTSDRVSVDSAVVSRTYFRVMRMRILEGRSFSMEDGPGASPVAVINESFSRRFFEDSDPLGKHLRLGDAKNPEPVQIIGVVSDARSSLNISPAPQVYINYLQSPWPAMYLVARGSGGAENLVGAVRETVATLDRNQPVSEIATMRSIWARYTVGTRFYSVLLGSFASVALILAIVGIYGAVSYLVSQRTREIGIRMAMGAKESDVIKLIVGYGMKLTLIAMAIGLIVAWVCTRLMTSLLFEIKSTDAQTYAAISLMLFFVSLSASYLPARRVCRMDPMSAIRQK